MQKNDEKSEKMFGCIKKSLHLQANNLNQNLLFF